MLSLAELVVALRMDERLCIISEEAEKQEPMIICSLGLFKEEIDFSQSYSYHP